MHLVALVVFFFASVLFGVGALTGLQLRAEIWQEALLIVVVTTISLVITLAGAWLWRHPAPGVSRVPMPDPARRRHRAPRAVRISSS